jgi:GGDEF domain-containing protein
VAAAAGRGAVAVDIPILGALAGVAGWAAGGVAYAAGTRVERAEAAQAEAEAVVEVEREALGRSEARVRMLEAVLSAQPSAPAADDLLNDAETGLPGRAYFAVCLDARVEAARRHLRPVAIVLLEITEPTGLPGDARFVADTLRATLRSADTACRLDGDRRYGLILEDTPESGAVWTVERLRRNLTARATAPHVVAAGVACYPAHALATEELRRRAFEALETARNWRQDRIEVATPADV